MLHFKKNVAFQDLIPSPKKTPRLPEKGVGDKKGLVGIQSSQFFLVYTNKTGWYPDAIIIIPHP